MSHVMRRLENPKLISTPAGFYLLDARVRFSRATCSFFRPSSVVGFHFEGQNIANCQSGVVFQSAPVWYSESIPDQCSARWRVSTKFHKPLMKRTPPVRHAERQQVGEYGCTGRRIGGAP